MWSDSQACEWMSPQTDWPCESYWDKGWISSLKSHYSRRRDRTVTTGHRESFVCGSVGLTLRYLMLQCLTMTADGRHLDRHFLCNLTRATIGEGSSGKTFFPRQLIRGLDLHKRQGTQEITQPLKENMLHYHIVLCAIIILIVIPTSDFHNSLIIHHWGYYFDFANLYM